MKSFTYTVTDPEGLHARPAGAFVKEVKKYPCVITITKGDKTADARKMFGVMGLSVKRGDTVTITTEGEQETEAAAALETFMKETL